MRRALRGAIRAERRSALGRASPEIRTMTNRLAGETSPYLLQHADNPVDWHPWGEEALALARREGKPILLSVGYSACHWCHVMAHESFEDPAVAAAMNARLRQHQGRSRGAPRSRPDLPDRARAADAPLGRLAAHDVPHAGRRAVLRRHVLSARRALRPCRASSTCCRGSPPPIASRGRRSPSRPRGSRMRSRVSNPAARTTRRLPAAAPDAALAALKRSFDPEHGGFGSAPKFPHADRSRALPRARRCATATSEARTVVRVTLATHGRRRHPRPARRRLLPLQRRRRMDDPAFREDALRQRSAARAVRGLRARDGRVARSPTSRATSSAG